MFPCAIVSIAGVVSVILGKIADSYGEVLRLIQNGIEF